MTNLQTLSLDQLSTISGGQQAPDATTGRRGTGSAPTSTSTGSDASGTAPSSSGRATYNNSIDLTGMAASDNTWNIRLQGEHRFNDNFSVDAHVQGGERNGRQSNEVGAGLHWRW